VTRLLLSAIVSISTILAGCSDVAVRIAPEFEGDDAGECSDGADNDENGLFDCDDEGCEGAPECVPNYPPGQPELRVEPPEPKTTDTLSCVIDVASFDPEGDVVEYAFNWSLDGDDTGITESTIGAEMTLKDQTWLCSVIPTDANGAVGPGASASQTIHNTPPEAPVVHVSPSEPVVTNNLSCVIDQESYDADGDKVTYSYAWLKNGSPLGVAEPNIDWTATEVSDQISCIASPWDGFEDGPVGEGWVTVHQDPKLWVSAGKDHTCSNQFDLSYACWGDNSYAQSEQGPAFNYYQLETGDTFTCGIRQNTGAADCWGDTGGNQHLTPLGSFIDLAAGTSHVCAVTAGGDLEVWGSALTWSDPTPVSSLYVAVSAADDYCCAVSETGGTSCWGNDPPVPSVAGNARDVAAGSEHVCVLDWDGNLSCHGDDTYGQVSGTLAAVFEQVDSGWRHSCAIESGTGFVGCWGDNTYGQGDAPTGEFVQVSAGHYSTCGKRSNDTVECWGCVGNDSGQCTPEFN
jgi:hypothetical protein